MNIPQIIPHIERKMGTDTVDAGLVIENTKENTGRIK